MLSNIRSLLVVLFIVSFLVSCAAPTSAPTQQPTAIPTQPVPTSTPGIPVEQVTIPVDNESFQATITGNGEIAVIIASNGEGAPSDWDLLVQALSANEHLRMVTFAYRNIVGTGDKDLAALLNYLRNEGVTKIICIGEGVGSNFCTHLQEEPEMIGMVFLATESLGIKADFPKLFLTADADPFGMAGSTERVFNQSTEPKTFKSYTAGVHGSALFKADVGPQVLADITSFMNEVVEGQ
jgi:hypothetical protein